VSTGEDEIKQTHTQKYRQAKPNQTKARKFGKQKNQ
jgi:hypothetical protein